MTTSNFLLMSQLPSVSIWSTIVWRSSGVIRARFPTLKCPESLSHAFRSATPPETASKVISVQDLAVAHLEDL